MKKHSIVVFIMTFLFLLSAIAAHASSSVLISIEETMVAVNEEIIVPIKISNNTGICGATLSISYDNSLSLESISTGDAFDSLIMTKPGNLTANPFNLVFDGVEEDTTDGVIAYLYFDAMTENGIYNILVSYEEGDIVNGNLDPLAVETSGGKVTVGEASGDNEWTDNDNEETEKHNGPIITFGKVVASAGDSIDVPVYVNNNTGICGTTLKIEYDKSLVLTKITKGDSLTNLIMTKPGNLTANPFNLVFDGIDEDTSNGLFFTLTFTAPQNDGMYDITATYEEGDIVNGNLIPVDVLIEKGCISVDSRNIEIVVDGTKVILPTADESAGGIYIAFYKEKECIMTSVKVFNLNNKEITVDADLSADYAKVFCWNDDLMPLCEAPKIILK